MTDRKSAPAMFFYGDDFLAGVIHLSPEDRGNYISIIARMVSEGGPIEHDERRLARICNTTTRRLRPSLQRLIDEGKVAVENGLVIQRRALDEIEKAARYRNEQAVHGSLGGKKRAENALNATRTRAEQAENRKKNNKTGQGSLKPPEPEPYRDSTLPLVPTAPRAPEPDAGSGRVLDSDSGSVDPATEAWSRFADLAGRIGLRDPGGAPGGPRLDALRSLAEAYGAGFPKLWARALVLVEGSPFLRGDDGDWQGAALGWLAKPENFAAVLDGRYSPPSEAGPKQASPGQALVIWAQTGTPPPGWTLPEALDAELRRAAYRAIGELETALAIAGGDPPGRPSFAAKRLAQRCADEGFRGAMQGRLETIRQLINDEPKKRKTSTG